MMQGPEWKRATNANDRVLSWLKSFGCFGDPLGSGFGFYGGLYVYSFNGSDAQKN